MPDRRIETFAALSSQAVSAAGQSSAAYVGDYAEANVFITVSVAGTTISPVIQISHDGTTYFGITGTWTKSSDLSSVTAIVATGDYRAGVTNIGKYLRVNWAGPTGSFTMVITIQAKN